MLQILQIMLYNCNSADGRLLKQIGDLVKQVRTPPVRPADGVVGCVYESFVPGVWHRWLEKEILWFCFRRAEPERMISGWTASSRDSSKTEEGKAPGVTDKFAPNSE